MRNLINSMSMFNVNSYECFVGNSYLRFYIELNRIESYLGYCPDPCKNARLDFYHFIIKALKRYERKMGPFLSGLFLC